MPIAYFIGGPMDLTKMARPHFEPFIRMVMPEYPDRPRTNIPMEQSLHVEDVTFRVRNIIYEVLPRFYPEVAECNEQPLIYIYRGTER